MSLPYRYYTIVIELRLKQPLINTDGTVLPAGSIVHRLEKFPVAIHNMRRDFTGFIKHFRLHYAQFGEVLSIKQVVHP